MKKLKGAETKLEKAVQRILNNKVEDGYPIESVLKDLAYGGCASGTIGELIYYTDTIRFYKRHKKEIQALLRETEQDCGVSHQEMFGDKWDRDDIFAEDTNNQNLLAWFGFEETAINLADRNNIEV